MCGAARWAALQSHACSVALEGASLTAAHPTQAWDKQFQDAKATPGPIPDGFFSGSLSEAQMQCVTNCQNAQQQAQANNQAFDWKTCQNNCINGN